MSNLFESHPKVAIGLVIVATGAAMFLSKLVKNQQEKMVGQIEETESGGQRLVVESDRMAEIRKTQNQDTDQALALVEAVLKNPSSADEKTQAMEKHAGILDTLVHKRLDVDEIDEALDFMTRLETLYPNAF